MKMEVQADNTPLAVKLLTAGTAACIADLVTFPLDTAKVRMQVWVYFVYSLLQNPKSTIIE